MAAAAAAAGNLHVGLSSAVYYCWACGRTSQRRVHLLAVSWLSPLSLHPQSGPLACTSVIQPLPILPFSWGQQSKCGLGRAGCRLRPAPFPPPPMPLPALFISLHPWQVDDDSVPPKGAVTRRCARSQKAFHSALGYLFNLNVSSICHVPGTGPGPSFLFPRTSQRV